MTDTTFREKQDSPVEEVQQTGKLTNSIGVTHPEPPYTDYEFEHGKPFTADYFELGSTWNDPNGGFSQELSALEEFVSNKIKEGELPNNTEAVKDAFKKMEKVVGLSKYDSPIKKIEMLSAYTKFLMTADKINFNLRRYGNH